MSASLSEAADRIESFLRSHFQVPDGDPGFTRQVNLWEAGYVDSMGVVEVIEYLEESFAIQLPEEAVFSPDFGSIDGIARLVVGLLPLDRAVS